MLRVCFTSILYTACNLQPSKSSRNHGHLWRMENQKAEAKRSVRSPREKDLYHWIRTVDAPGQKLVCLPQQWREQNRADSLPNWYYKSQAVICIFHQSCSYIPLCNIIWLISNVIWVTAVYMYLYTFKSNLFCTYYRSKLGIPLVITEICNTWLVSPEDVTLLETCNHQNSQTCVTVWQTTSDCCSRYRYICVADLCLPQKPSIWEVVHEDREKQIPGYRWHLQDLWRGDLWRVAWLSQCYKVW